MGLTGWLPDGDPTWQVIQPELVVLLFALLAPLVGISNPDRRGMRSFALVGLGGAFLITLGTVMHWTASVDVINLTFNMDFIGHDLRGIYFITEASQLFKLLFLGCAFLAVVGIGRPLSGRTEEDWGEFYSLLLFAVLGMMVVASARELITLLLGIETASFASYLLAGFARDRLGAEASLKYFVVGAISSGMTLFAVSLLYGLTGTTMLEGIGQQLALGGGLDAMAMVAIVLLLAGLGFKVSSVPFHAWAPDVYCGAPAPVAGLLASASKAMGFVAVFQVFLVALLGVKADWELAVALLAAASMFVGNLVALQQTSIRRMLAYSSIAQAGYLLIAVAVGTVYAVGGGILHLWVNAAMKLGAFLVVGALLYAGIPDHLEGWRGLGRRTPLLAFAMAVFLLSMAGLPPFGGFTSKFVLFSGAVDAGVVGENGWLLLLAGVAVLNSAISLYYYLRVIRAMYVEPSEPASAGRIELPSGVLAAVLGCLAVVLVVGVWPEWFVNASMDAAASLMAPAAP